VGHPTEADEARGQAWSLPEQPRRTTQSRQTVFTLPAGASMNDLVNAQGQRSTVSVIVAFFNEEEAIVPLVGRLLPVIARLNMDWKTELILVNDGSVDGTWALLNKEFATTPAGRTAILQHATNLGLGAAMRTAFQAATGDIVCTIDSDCTYAPEELPALLDLLIRSGADIVTGSPYHPDAGGLDAPRWRLFLSKAANRLYATVVPVKLYCYTSLFRAYRREWARADFFRSNRFLAVSEILVTAAFRGAKIVEYPVRLGKRSYGQSKMKVLRTALSHLGLMTKAATMRVTHKRRTGERK